MITFGAKVASSIASLYDSESITWASGHTARVGRSHAVDVGPDMYLRRVQQRAEDRGGKNRCRCAESGLHAARIAGDEAGNHQRRRRLRRQQCRSLCLDSCHCTPGPSGPHCTVTQRRGIEPLHAADVATPRR